jgi:hypothetical protein
MADDAGPTADRGQNAATPTARLRELMPLCATLGIEATARVDRDEVVVTMAGR